MIHLAFLFMAFWVALYATAIGVIIVGGIVTVGPGVTLAIYFAALLALPPWMQLGLAIVKRVLWPKS